MFKREIKPLSESMVESIAKSINKLEYIEEKASRPADRADGDVKPNDISGEEEVKADGSAKKAPARKGDQAQADSMEKVKEEVELEENMVASLAKDFEKRLKKAGNSDSNQNRERMATLAMAKKKGASAMDMKNLDKAMNDVMNKLDEALDPVNPKAVKKKFDDRKDKDLDNDGDTDSSDEYLHKRRKAISKALAKEENANFNQPITEKMGDDDWVHIDRAGSFYNPKKDKIIGYSKSPKDPNRAPKLKAGANSAMRIADAKKKGYAIKEEVELEEGNMASAAKELEMYARKNGGIDKGDFMKAVVMMKKGQKPQLKKFVDDLDTEPREKILSVMQKHMKEEVELDEAKNYEYKDGKVHISKANFRKVHKDYKNTTKGKERMMVLDPKTQASVSAPVVFTEAKSDYTINHKTFSSAVQHAVEVAKKRGYEVDEEDYDRKVALGPRKPSKGKTNSYSIDLTKNGKPVKQKLQMQVYYDEGRYELNMYIQ